MKRGDAKRCSALLAVGAAAMMLTAPGAAQAQSLGDLVGAAKKKRGDSVREERQDRTGDRTQPERRTTTSRVSAADKDTAAAVTEIVDRITRFRFSIDFYEWDDAGTIERAEAELDAFRNELNAAITGDVIAAAGDDGNRRMVRVQERADRFAEGFDGTIARYNIGNITEKTDAKLVFQAYANLLQLQERLRQLQRLFPGSATVNSANERADALMGQIGNFGAVKARQEANYAALVAKRRMYPAVRSDAALEANFRSAFWGSPFNRDWQGGEILRTHLISRGWRVQHHPATGVPVSRDQSADVAVKAPDGKCYTVTAIFEQKYTGGGYGGTYYRSGDKDEMLCENIPG